MHESIDGKIIYEIINGQCTYCGRDADVIELPDGGTDISNRCRYCDDYNLELKIYQSAGLNDG